MTNSDPFKGMYYDTFQYIEGERIVYRVGQSFKDVYAVRDALRDYVIQGGMN